LPLVSRFPYKGFRITILAPAALCTTDRSNQASPNAVFDHARERLRFGGLRRRFRSPLNFDADI